MRLPATDWTLIVAGALVLTLAYPPYALWVPPFVCLVPAALLLLRGGYDPDPWRRHLYQGFWYGAVTHGALLYWMGLALWDFGPAAVGLYVAAAVMFGGGTAVMFGVVGLIVRRGPRALLIALPAGVVFLEWLAAQVGPIGFPWHQLALTLTAYPVLIQAADLAGGAGVAFALAAVNAALALAWWRRRERPALIANLEAAATIVVALTLYGLHELNADVAEHGPTVAVVQPNIASDQKWTPRARDAAVDRAVRITEDAIAQASPALVVWPETALPDALRGRPGWSSSVTRLATRSGSTILTGGVERVSFGGGAPRSYNAAFAFAPGSRDARVLHRKQKLVPAIEWVPGAALDLSRTGFGGFTPGRGSPAVAESPAGRVAVLLCYELTFGAMSRAARRDGAEVLVSMSNDVWFGRTAAPHQHFAHATLRAVENRVPVIRAANTGVSGIVDPFGGVVTSAEPYVATWVAGRVPRAASVPLAAHLGGWVGPLALALLVTLLVRSRGPVVVRAQGMPQSLELVLPSGAVPRPERFVGQADVREHEMRAPLVGVETEGDRAGGGLPFHQPGV